MNPLYQYVTIYSNITIVLNNTLISIQCEIIQKLTVLLSSS